MDSGDLFEGSVNPTGPTSFASLRAGRAGAQGGLGAADGESRPRPLTRPVCTCRPDAPPPPASQGARTARRVARGPWHRHLRHGWGADREGTPEARTPLFLDRKLLPGSLSEKQGPPVRSHTAGVEGGFAETSGSEKSSLLRMGLLWGQPRAGGGRGVLCAGGGSGRCGRWRWGRGRPPAGPAQSSMASSWSARASNMMLMSSRMCLAEAPGALRQGRARSGGPVVCTLLALGTGPGWGQRQVCVLPRLTQLPEVMGVTDPSSHRGAGVHRSDWSKLACL